MVDSVQAKKSIIGKARPSFKPLSTTNVRRSSAGTDLLLTTAWLNAASVGANMAAANAAARIGQDGKIAIMTPVQRITANGKPISNIRLGHI